MYVRFLQQSELFKEHGHPVRGDPKDRRLCMAALVVGWLSALGLSMVANFQVQELIFLLFFFKTVLIGVIVNLPDMTFARG